MGAGITAALVPGAVAGALPDYTRQEQSEGGGESPHMAAPIPSPVLPAMGNDDLGELAPR